MTNPPPTRPSDRPGPWLPVLPVRMGQTRREARKRKTSGLQLSSPSTLIPSPRAALSPRRCMGGGVMETLPLALPPEEEQALARSARVVRDAIDGLAVA